MTDKEKLEKAVKLADAMYYAAQYLTTDASRLRKAMDEYHKFIVYEYNKQEPASEDLEKAAIIYINTPRCKTREDEIIDNVSSRGEYYAFKAGAEWQKKQDLQTIELAEDHAMLAGMNKMEEEMIAKAVRGRVSVNANSNYHSLIYGCWDMDNALKNCNDGDKVKVIIAKDND